MTNEIIIKGIAAAPGIISGPAFILDQQDYIVNKRTLLEEEILIEIARFEEAVNSTRREIEHVKAKISKGMGQDHAKIFDAHLLVLSDPSLIDKVIKGIKEEALCCEYVLSTLLKNYTQSFSEIKDEYLKERTSDFTDVGRRLLKHLTDESRFHEFDSGEPLIIVAHDVAPSDAVSLYDKNILAFVADLGGKTSHTAIISKSWGIPAVCGLKDATLRIRNQDYLIIDGYKGVVIINPTEQTKKIYQKEQDKIGEIQNELDDLKDLPAETLDGKRIDILGNLELTSELDSIINAKVDGIGLYRTEFFYMNRYDLPSEEEQYEAYKKVLESAFPNPVTIRTLDLGGDKFISSVHIPKEIDPFMGMRAIRFCLEQPDIFKTQLRAILRASVHGNLRIMYPMISSIQELEDANNILNKVMDDLRQEGIDFNEDIEVGIMVEVPAAVAMADLLAKEADFFSIGTNDLIQYTLAVDRVNQSTAHLYEPSNPGVLRMIHKAVEDGHDGAIKVSLCGEMCSEPIMAFVLLGLGVDSFSMSAADVLRVKKLIRSVRFEDAKRIAQETLDLGSGAQVEAFVKKKLQSMLSDYDIG